MIKRPRGVNAIILFSILGWLTTEGLWVYLHFTHQIPAVSSMHSYWEKSYIGLVNGFTAADALWSNITLVLSIIGLMKMKTWGWTAAMMSNTIWVYTMTYTMVRDIMVKATFGMAFFSVFALGAMISTVYLWRIRRLFWDSDITAEKNLQPSGK